MKRSRTAILALASVTASVTLTVASPFPTAALAADCAPTSSTFVGGGTENSASATYGTLGVNYTELRFTSVGTCEWTVPSSVASIDIVLVGGGGGGGSGSRAGGGGAGELAYKTSYSVTAGSTISVAVGAGGVAGVDNVSAATSGAQTVFGSASAKGGGRGGGRLAAGELAEAGGSSGGARGFSTARTAVLATTTTDGLSFTRLANNGGGTDGGSFGAGGGGAGGAAFALATIYSADPGTQPNGGASFTVFGHELAGGGSGWTGGSTGAGTFPSAGGGLVGGSYSPQRAALANTGSGGHAGGIAGDGASGVVIVRYQTPIDEGPGDESGDSGGEESGDSGGEESGDSGGEESGDSGGDSSSGAGTTSKSELAATGVSGAFFGWLSLGLLLFGTALIRIATRSGHVEGTLARLAVKKQ